MNKTWAITPVHFISYVRTFWPTRITTNYDEIDK